MYKHVAALADWRAAHRSELPPLVWMDVPVQHFSGPDGAWNDGNKKPFRCAPLQARDSAVAGAARRTRGRAGRMQGACVAAPSMMTAALPLAPSPLLLPCAALQAWYDGNERVRRGLGRNMALAPLIPKLADAHLKTW